MALPVSSLQKPPYARAFAIEELLMVRDWCQQRGLLMTVVLDQVLDHAEFEEMLVLSPPDRRRRTLTMWRTVGSVLLQVPKGCPHAFETVPAALASLRPARRKRRSLLRFLGLVV